MEERDSWLEFQLGTEEEADPEWEHGESVQVDDRISEETGERHVSDDAKRPLDGEEKVEINALREERGGGSAHGGGWVRA